jgi:hypothetical protein
MSKMMRNYIIGLSIAIVIYTVIVSWLTIRSIMVPPEVIDTIILFILASATIFYAIRTSDIAEATKQQAAASVRMAEEIREQRITTSRPVMIQKAMPTIIDGTTTDVFSHFEVYNAGNGPAIELQVSLLDKEKRPLRALRETSVKAGESPIRPSAFRPAVPFELADLPESTYYIVCEYQSIFSRLSKKQTWYQTWLPFQRCKSSQGGVRVEPGELEFGEIHENERIDAFGKLKSM